MLAAYCMKASVWEIRLASFPQYWYVHHRVSYADATMTPSAQTWSIFQDIEKNRYFLINETAIGVCSSVWFRDTQRHTSSTSRVGRRVSYAAVDTRYVCAASFLICLCSYEQVCHFSISITFNPFRSLEYDVRTATYCSLWNCPEFYTSTRAIKSASPLCHIYWRNYQRYSHDRDIRSWKITGETWLCEMTLIQFNEHAINSAPQEFQV